MIDGPAMSGVDAYSTRPAFSEAVLCRSEIGTEGMIELAGGPSACWGEAGAHS